MLVNVWLDHHPKSVVPFPSNAMEHMGKDLELLVHDSPQRREPDSSVQTWHIGAGSVSAAGASDNASIGADGLFQVVSLEESASVDLPQQAAESAIRMRIPRCFWHDVAPVGSSALLTYERGCGVDITGGSKPMEAEP